MAYQAIILSGLQSMHPETVVALKEFVDNGGKLVMIDSIPSRSLSFQNAADSDKIVRNTINELIEEHPDHVFVVESPKNHDELLNWTNQLIGQVIIPADVVIDEPDSNIFQIRHIKENRDIYFFTNANRKKSASITVSFPVESKIPWIWDPETGSKSVFPAGDSNEFTLDFNPLQSMLIVFEPDRSRNGREYKNKQVNTSGADEITGQWKVTFDHVNGNEFEKSLTGLIDFKSSNDPLLKNFAGKISYNITFSGTKDYHWLDLGEVNQGITEVYLNNKHIGTKWYGKHYYDISEYIKDGENKLEIRYVTVLANYCKSLTDNPTAQKWTSGYDHISMGLLGPVQIEKSVNL